MLIGLLLLLMLGGDDMVKLPSPDFTDVSIEECMERRRSVRSYKDKELSLQQISNILWAAQGITEDRYEFRTVPSAGATYPLEVFIAKNDGLYRYVPQSHGLKQESDKDLRQSIAKAALGQGFIAGAGAVIIITAHQMYKNLDLNHIKSLMNDSPILIDGRKTLDPEKVLNAGFIYRSIGRGQYIP